MNVVTMTPSSSRRESKLSSYRREKVDLTQYIEEHNYVFDAVYDEFATNENVSSMTPDL